jgi:hypothetical protein
MGKNEVALKLLYFNTQMSVAILAQDIWVLKYNSFSATSFLPIQISNNAGNVDLCFDCFPWHAIGGSTAKRNTCAESNRNDERDVGKGKIRERS